MEAWVNRVLVRHEATKRSGSGSVVVHCQVWLIYQQPAAGSLRPLKSGDEFVEAVHRFSERYVAYNISQSHGEHL